MTRQELVTAIFKKKSFLCIGLDPDPARLPAHLLGQQDPYFTFCKEIIDATADLCVAYKPNTAFFEAQGVEGWQSLQKVINYIPKNTLSIADAKRGDIGNTSRMYATAFFEKMGADALTVAPYMGHDSVKPFLTFENKWTILLALTSNPGSADFQHNQTDDLPLHLDVINKAKIWGSSEQLMFVVGATQAAYLKKIREVVPDYFLLVPGVGAQGGSLKEVAAAALTKEAGLLVNSSRGIIYAGNGKDFANKARQAAQAIQQEMKLYLKELKKS